jgi:hypothetical protein
VIAFYTGKADAAHISFVKEARPWFARMAAEHQFSFASTQDWDNLNPDFLASYQVVVFLDTRPDSPRQREAFQQDMKNGGAWMGFHFSSTFANKVQNRLILNALEWLGTGTKPQSPGGNHPGGP